MRIGIKYSIITLLLLAIVMSACQVKERNKDAAEGSMKQSPMIFYEIFIRSFYDSDGDGVGDLQGIIQKLDYLSDLGIEAIWLTPFNPSPSYHGYDVTDYYDINPEFGTLDDFRLLIAEANNRDIKIIMDLVINHTSSQHPWFIQSAMGEDNEYRDWYVWAGEDENVTRHGAVGGQAWHRKNGDHYLGIFWGGMPDLNLDHPPVREEVIRIGHFWLEQGVHGFRLDAAKHIYEDFPSRYPDPEVVDNNIGWWNEFREGMNKVNPDAFIIGEVWDNSAAVIAPYLEPFDSAFNFGIAADMINSVRNERSADFAFKLNRIYPLFEEVSMGRFVDAPFLTNHDQNRVMSELNGNMDHAKMAAALLLTMPGSPFIYYGEEIGMEGQKPDEQIREPMLWYADGHSGPGQTTWQRAKYNLDDSISVEQQLDDPESLLNHYKQLIQWRKQEPALRNGAIAEYNLYNRQIASFVRKIDDESVLVIHNLSSENQEVQLNGGEGDTFTDVFLSTNEDYTMQGTQLTVPAYTTLILK